MPDKPADAVALTQELVRCPSVTPAEGGALTFLEGQLSSAGFHCERLVFSDADCPDVENLFARIGDKAPHLSFAGHTDVVPPGDEAAWTYPPFSGEIVDGTLYGRGAADMKGGVAAFLAAALDFVAERGGDLPGSLSFLITGDEEAIAVNGTIKVLKWMAENGHTPNHCIVGEPTNSVRIGDEIKIGRRGSVTGDLTVRGKQGHVAYQKLALNPVPTMLRVLTALTDEPIDKGSDHFEPTNLEVTTIDIANKADNIIPSQVHAKFNVRYNDHHTQDSLRELLRKRVEKAAGNSHARVELSFSGSSEVFVTEPGPLVDCMAEAITAVTGHRPKTSTSGGTSDARFIKDYCPVMEFGLINQTMHQVDERMEVRHIEELKAVYTDFLERYFRTFG